MLAKVPQRADCGVSATSAAQWAVTMAAPCRQWGGRTAASQGGRYRGGVARARPFGARPWLKYERARFILAVAAAARHRDAVRGGAEHRGVTRWRMIRD